MPGKKLLIFGGGGFVGGNLATLALQRGWQVDIADHTYKPGLEGAEWLSVDITSEDEVQDVIGETSPEAVVNVAALAAIDLAEREKELAWGVNAQGAGYVAKNCAALGVRHIYFSSDAVFDGEGGPYAEDDPLGPVNYYGRTKAAGEKAVLEQPGAVVIRISLVLGYPITSGNSFLAGLDAKLASGSEVYSPLDEIRTPIDVSTLCECVLELVEGDYEGILHLSCTESIDRYTLTQRLAVKMGYPPDRVHPQASQVNLPGRAPRHKNGVLDVSRAGEVLKTRLPGLDITINRAVK